MKLKTFTLSLLAVTALTSCMDNSYDLDDIDMKLGFGAPDNVLWLPKSSTGPAVCKNLFSLDDNQILVYEPDATGREFYCLETDTDNILNMKLDPNVGYVELLEGDTTITITMTNRPSFLHNSKTYLDLICPRFLIELDNQSEIDIKTGFNLRSCDNKHVAKTEGQDFVAPAKQKKYYYVSDYEDQAGLPADLDGMDWTNAEWIKFEGLRDLIAGIPDSVAAELVNFEGHGPGHKIEEGVFKINYRFYSPVDVGDKFSIDDRDSTDHWHADLKDVKVDAKQLIAKAKVSGTMPMEIDASLEPINLKGEKLEGLIVSSDSLKYVPSLSIDGDTETEIAIYITPKDGYTLEQFLTGEGDDVLDGIRFDYGLNTKKDGTSTGKRIYNDMYIQLKDIVFGLKGTLIYDAN